MASSVSTGLFYVRFDLGNALGTLRAHIPFREPMRFYLGITGPLVLALIGGCVQNSRESDGRCVETSNQGLYGGGSNALTQDADLLLQRRAIGALEDKIGILYCTAVLVHRDYVLTAAHCVDEGAELMLRLAADIAPAARVSLGDPVIHAAADLALLEVLEPEALEAAGVKPFPLRLTRYDAEMSIGASVTLAGVGLRNDGSHGTLEFLDEQVSALEAASITVDGKGKTGACRGDSGGPLLVPGRDSPQEVAGILSTGDSSCRGVDTYVRLAEHADWMRAVLDLPEENPCEPTTD